MKRLQNIDDGKLIMRIEAARISFEVLSLSFHDLKIGLNIIDPNNPSSLIVIRCLKNAWEFIDSSHRFCTLVSQVKGLKHRDARFKMTQKVAKEIVKHRNLLQHLNNEIPKSINEVYPINGAISWPSEDGKKSYTISLGMLPKDSYFHSLNFDYRTNKFSEAIIFNSGIEQLNLTNTIETLIKCNEYLHEWLTQNNMLGSEEANPSFLLAETFEHVKPPLGTNFGRVRFKAN